MDPDHLGGYIFLLLCSLPGYLVSLVSELDTPQLAKSSSSTSPSKASKSDIHTIDLNPSGSTKQKILSAGLKLFVERGYFGTNVPDLSKESGCSIGSIYHAFKSKEEVAALLYKDGMYKLRSTLASEISAISDEQDIIKTVVKSFLKFSQEKQLLSRYLWLSRHNEFVRDLIHHPTRVGLDPLGRTLTRAIKGGIRKGLIRELPVQVIWSLLFGIPLSYVRDWLDGYANIPPTEVAEELAVSCWRALKSSVSHDFPTFSSEKVGKS